MIRGSKISEKSQLFNEYKVNTKYPRVTRVQHYQFVSFSPTFEIRLGTTDENGEHTGSEFLQCIRGISVTDENGWTHIQQVSCLQHLSKSDHWQKWMNTHPASELLFIGSIWVDQPLMRMGGHPACELHLSGLEPLTKMSKHPSRQWVTLQCLADWNPWQKWANIHPESESLSTAVFQ